MIAGIVIGVFAVIGLLVSFCSGYWKAAEHYLVAISELMDESDSHDRELLRTLVKRMPSIKREAK